MSPAPAGGDEAVTVELFVRSLAPRESRQRLASIVRQLDALVTAGAVSEYEVILTGGELPATRTAAITDAGMALLDRVEIFREWARATGRSLDATFQRKRISSRITGEDHEVLVVPTVAMAEYAGEDLRFVAPCADEDEDWTVLDRLDTLASEEPLPDDDRLPRARTLLSADAEEATPGDQDAREPASGGEASENAAGRLAERPDDWQRPGTGL